MHSDGVMAYLLMCEPDGVQVMCVTYSANSLKRGDVVVLGGGYSGPTIAMSCRIRAWRRANSRCGRAFAP